MVWIAEIILVGPVTLAMAWWHSRLITAGRKILHALWAGLYALLICCAIVLLGHHLPGWTPAGIFALACACGHLVVFNVSLNRFRGLSWRYVSPSSTSIIDKISFRFFGTRYWIFEVVLGGVFVILQFFI